MSWLWRRLRKLPVNGRWLAAAVLAGLLLHLGTVLAINHFLPNRAIAAIAQLGPANQMTVLEPVAKGHQPLPFLSPMERYAVCRFDLRKGPVALHTVLGGDDWTLAIYGATGANVFAAAGSDLERYEVELLLALNSDGTGAGLPIAKDAGVATTLALTERTGIAIISAPVGQSAYGDLTDRLLAEATCTQRPKSLPQAG